MRRWLLAVFGAVTIASAASFAGCTFLIQFDDAAPLDGGADASDGAAPPDAKPDAATDAGPPAFPPPCDPAFPLSQLKCNPDFPRPNCAKTTTVFPSYPAGQDRTNDLVTCNGGANPTCVQHCPFGCATMPTGYPDACDDCNGRADGTYCVKDLRGPDGRNLGLAVDCKGGKTVDAHVCGVGKCATKCPRAAPAPSCCI
jgi:hypothetical protein